MTLSYVSLLLGLLLLIVPGYMLYAYDRLTLRHALLSLVRMTVQLTVMGGCLWALFRFDSVWLNLLWVVVLVLATTFIVVSRTRIRSRVLFLPVCLATLVSVILVSFYVLWAVLRPESPMAARWLVPVSGVLTAHVMTTNIHALRTYFDSLTQNSQPYYTLLGNGATRLQALAPYITRALKSLLTPAFANMSALGLFVMPMLLSGMLLGGMGPVEAVAVYILLIVAGITASIVALFGALWLSDRKVFNKQGSLTNVFLAD